MASHEITILKICLMFKCSHVSEKLDTKPKLVGHQSQLPNFGCHGPWSFEFLTHNSSNTQLVVFFKYTSVVHPTQKIATYSTSSSAMGSYCPVFFLGPWCFFSPTCSWESPPCTHSSRDSQPHFFQGKTTGKKNGKPRDNSGSRSEIQTSSISRNKEQHNVS